jgi:hypothetical protein
VTIHATELQRRIDSGEPIATTRNWYLNLREPWQVYFFELEPVEQEFVMDLTLDYLAWVETQENLDRAMTRKQ